MAARERGAIAQMLFEASGRGVVARGSVSGESETPVAAAACTAPSPRDGRWRSSGGRALPHGDVTMLSVYARSMRAGVPRPVPSPVRNEERIGVAERAVAAENGLSTSRSLRRGEAKRR